MKDFAAGQKINSHSSLEVLALLGEGAFGKVFLVQKNFLSGLLPRRYALKIFHSSVSTEVLCAEFAATFASRSPHCVVVHSIEEFQGGRGLLMEYIDGVTLEDLAKHFELTPDEHRNLLSQIRAGIGDLHRQGLVHGDLSPRNVMIDREGRVVLLDFGLTSVVAAGEVVGQPAYLSSARLGGASATREDDIFAISLMAFDLEQKNLGKAAPPIFWEKRKALVAQGGQTTSSGSATQRLKSLQLRVSLLLQRREVQHQTLLSSSFNLASRSFRVLNIVFLAFLMTAFRASSRELEVGWLSIRSLKWVKLHLPGGALLEANDAEAEIPVGKHQLIWQTARQSGSKIIEIEPHEKRILTESDFN